MQLVKLVGGGDKDEAQIEPTLDFIDGQIQQVEERLRMLRKARAELVALGPAKFDRIISILSHRKDPDAPVEKVGPHGPGCECKPIDAPEESVN